MKKHHTLILFMFYFFLLNTDSFSQNTDSITVNNKFNSPVISIRIDFINANNSVINRVIQVPQFCNLTYVAQSIPPGYLIKRVYVYDYGFNWSQIPNNTVRIIQVSRSNLYRFENELNSSTGAIRVINMVGEGASSDF